MRKIYKLHTDACRTGLGAVLTQDFPVPGKFDKNGNQIYKERVISYASASNQGAVQNYGATQLEQLAVVWAVEHYKHYLGGKPFQVITDHTALKSLMKMENPPALYARWIMRLMPYDIDVVYKKGKLHSHANTLSRRPHRNQPQKEVTIIERLGKGPPFTEPY